MDYSNKIIMIREKFQLSQNDLASLLNVNIYDIKGWESGTQSLNRENLSAFYETFRVSEKMLFNEKDKCEVYFFKKKLEKNYQIFDFINEYYGSWRVCALKKAKDLFFINSIVDFLLPFTDPETVVLNWLEDKYRNHRHYLNYVLEMNNKSLLITYKKGCAYVQPIKSTETKKRFKYNGYLYKKIGYLE